MADERVILKAGIKGFRSIKKMDLDFGNGVNLFAGLNDHGKSNVFRALNLFFTGEPEPETQFNYESEICRIGERSQKKIEIEVFFKPSFLHKALLDSIKRKQIPKDSTVSIRKVWAAQAGGFSSRIDVKIESTKGKFSVYTDGEYKGNANEKVSSPHAPVKFKDEVEKLFSRFRVRYLPSNATGEIFSQAGLATEVKHYLFDGYQQGVGSKFQKISQDLKQIRELLEEMVRSEFGEKITNELAGVFPGLTTASISIPENTELINIGDLQLHRSKLGIPLSSCGSGLQSVVILETLRFLDQNIRTRNSLKKHVIWLIEEPEAFLYEDLVTAVSKTLVSAAGDFTVLATTHSRDFSNATEGSLSWVELEEKNGTVISEKFDLSKSRGRSRFAEYAGKKFGKGWLQLWALQQIKDVENRPGIPVIFVEGKTDKQVLEKVFELLPFKGGVEIKVGITDFQSNAAQVAASAAAMARMDPSRLIIGLFDNDWEGCKRHDELVKVISDENLKKCRSVLLPCPPQLKQVELGGVVDNETIPLGKTEDLEGKGVALEALFDDPQIESILVKKKFFFSHWYSMPTDKTSKNKFQRLTGQSKASVSGFVTTLLNQDNLGSLKTLRRTLGSALGEPLDFEV